jgi:uncharacterized membrane protein required for colicin V production
MVSLNFIFWMFVVLFGIIGAMRGWAKELLVAFSMILALTLLRLIETFVPFVRSLLPLQQLIDDQGTFVPPVDTTVFWMRVIIVVVLVFFGYQTVALPRFATKAAREKLQDIMLGFVFGAVNGYLVVGTLWYFMHASGYPFEYISAPVFGTPTGDAALGLIKYLPPTLLGEPTIYFAVVLAFIFVLVVFI